MNRPALRLLAPLLLGLAGGCEPNRVAPSAPEPSAPEQTAPEPVREQNVPEQITPKETPADPRACRAPALMHFVLDGEIVLSSRAEDSWADGPPTFEREEGEVVMGRPVAQDRVPQADGAWVGRKVRLFDEKGASCEGVVDRLRLMGRGEDVDDHDGTWSAALYWDHLEPILVAHVRDLSPACKRSARFAVDASHPFPRVASSRAPAAQLTRTATEALQARATYTDTFSDGEEARHHTVLAVDAIRERVRTRVVAASALGNAEHWQPPAAWSVFFHDPRRGTLLPVFDAQGLDVDEMLALDLDRDGTSELVIFGGDDRMLLLWQEERYCIASELTTPTRFHGMP